MRGVHEFPPPPRPCSSQMPETTNTASSSSHLRKQPSSFISPAKADFQVNGQQREILDESEDMYIDSDGDAETESGDEEEDKPVCHVEVRLHPYSTRIPQHISSLVSQWIEANITEMSFGSELRGWEETSSLDQNVERIWVEEDGSGGETSINIAKADIEIHVYRPSDDEIEEFTADLEENEDEEKVSAASVRPLPSIELDGVWDTLVYSDDIKSRLLNYIYSTVFFSEADIDSNVVAWNRVILLHGPPGTGKTSLCRALAQKILTRLAQRYRHGKLIEINSHSLFSKWFSESGKLVQKLFQNVTEMVDDDGSFVVVMIDEVESLTAARAGAMTGNEPSDALRVVNALLTQLDRLRTRKNVLVMTTSNLLGAIDEAFISRVDLQEFVPLPPPQAIYTILLSIIKEMMNKGLIKPLELLTWPTVQRRLRSEGRLLDNRRGCVAAEALVRLATKCHALELSGRTLRKLPVLAHTRYLSSKSAFRSNTEDRPKRLEKWIEAMDRYVDLEAEKKKMNEMMSKKGMEEDKKRRGIWDEGKSAQTQTQTRMNGVGKGGHGRTPSLERSEVGLLVATKGTAHHHQH